MSKSLLDLGKNVSSTATEDSKYTGTTPQYAGQLRSGKVKKPRADVCQRLLVAWVLSNVDLLSKLARLDTAMLDTRASFHQAVELPEVNLSLQHQQCLAAEMKVRHLSGIFRETIFRSVRPSESEPRRTLTSLFLTGDRPLWRFLVQVQDLINTSESDMSRRRLQEVLAECMRASVWDLKFLTADPAHRGESDYMLVDELIICSSVWFKVATDGVCRSPAYINTAISVFLLDLAWICKQFRGVMDVAVHALSYILSVCAVPEVVQIVSGQGGASTRLMESVLERCRERDHVGLIRMLDHAFTAEEYDASVA